MTITNLAETAVIADLADDEDLAALIPKPRDHDGKLGGDDEPGADEAATTLSVTAVDHGDFHAGSGLKKVLVTVEIRSNGVGEDASAEKLDTLAELAGDRLQPSTTIEGVVGREEAFSSDALKVFGILAATPEPRENEDLIRIRRVARMFICAQLV
jgi:hypothetical protein